MKNPTIGEIVHYVSYGSPNGEYQSECRAAIVTEIENYNDGDYVKVGLCVLNPTGCFFNRSVAYDNEHRGGTFHCCPH